MVIEREKEKEREREKQRERENKSGLLNPPPNHSHHPAPLPSLSCKNKNPNNQSISHKEKKKPKKKKNTKKKLEKAKTCFSPPLTHSLVAGGGPGSRPGLAGPLRQRRDPEARRAALAVAPGRAGDVDVGPLDSLLVAGGVERGKEKK